MGTPRQEHSSLLPVPPLLNEPLMDLDAMLPSTLKSEELESNPQPQSPRIQGLTFMMGETLHLVPCAQASQRAQCTLGPRFMTLQRSLDLQSLTAVPLACSQPTYTPKWAPLAVE